MQPRLLFIVTGDPRSSGRPAEVVRLAAGVGTWKKVAITIYLRDAAVLALADFASGLVDEDNFTRYLPLVTEDGPIYVQNGAMAAARVVSSWPLREISDIELAALAALQTCVMRF